MMSSYHYVVNLINGHNDLEIFLFCNNISHTDVVKTAVQCIVDIKFDHFVELYYYQCLH